MSTELMDEEISGKRTRRLVTTREARRSLHEQGGRSRDTDKKKQAFYDLRARRSEEHYGPADSIAGLLSPIPCTAGDDGFVVHRRQPRPD